MAHFELIAGLGNPGPRYHTTRHNAGFMALDVLYSECCAEGQQLSWDSQDGVVISDIRIDSERVLLVKPALLRGASALRVLCAEGVDAACRLYNEWSDGGCG